MKRSEYNLYVAKVNAFLKREGIESFTTRDEQSEPFFSWRSCDCCGRSGGSLENANAYHEASGEIFDYEICPDCLYFIVYGTLDDMTMMDMEEDVDND